MATHARDRQSCRWYDRDAPSGGGCRGLAEIGGFGLSTPAAQDETDRAATLGTKLQPPGGSHIEPRNFTDHSAEAAMAQSFLDAGQYGIVIASLNVDHAVGREAGLSQGRGEQIRSGNDPENLAIRPCCDAGRKERCSRAIDSAVTAACDFVERAKGEAAARQPRVDIGDPEWERRFHALASAFDLFDLRAQ